MAETSTSSAAADTNRPSSGPPNSGADSAPDISASETASSLANANGASMVATADQPMSEDDTTMETVYSESSVTSDNDEDSTADTSSAGGSTVMEINAMLEDSTKGNAAEDAGNWDTATSTRTHQEMR